MPAKGTLAVILPPLRSVILRGIKKVRVNLTSQERKRFRALGLDSSTAYRLVKQEGIIESLFVPPKKAWKIGVLYNTVTRGRSNSAARFTILARQGNKLLGGSTYILRYGGGDIKRQRQK
jgi:hypothetical protein